MKDRELLQTLIDARTYVEGVGDGMGTLIILTPEEFDRILSLHARMIQEYPLYRIDEKTGEFKLAETSDCEEHF